MRILVADDDPFVRALLQLRLEGDGHEVALVSNGTDTLRQVGASPPDLLVLDITMPGVDGLEVTRILRSQPETERLPIVLLTGRDTDRDVVLGWKTGASYYIIKPLVIEQLRYFIRTLETKPKPVHRWRVEID